ncbi:hypothetical protein FHS43_001517 [Streptosporangium becharense]|uniref:CHAT domain-containing protein n=1 Tax=Streptosporangium becharense TaxID=1816182 RepID=A0A7W9ILP0_9ACTN|nr:hypothetical protein [Streptosporangium becharense]MBB2910254.1 hypothetical protein [Streptosporangium becharense]MBB5822997.1 hypothetical protein [Streptosporangium becharense]
MNPVAVVRAARTVRDELDDLMGRSAGELRGRLDPLLAEAGDRPAAQLADSLVMLIAEYGPAWDRLATLLSLEHGLTAEQVIPMLAEPRNAKAPASRDHGFARESAPGGTAPEWPVPGEWPAPETGTEAGAEAVPGGVPGTGPQAHPGSALSEWPAAGATAPPSGPGHLPPPQAPGAYGPPPDEAATAMSRAPGAERGPSMLDRLTGAFRKRRKESADAPTGTFPAVRLPADGPEWEAAPLIEAPGEVVGGWGVDMVVGVGPGEGLEEAVPRGPVELDIQLVAEGFDAPAGWRVRLLADQANPYPRAAVSLVALPHEETETARQIEAVYTVRGQVAGYGVRAITVLGSPGKLSGEEVPEPVSGTRINPAALSEPPDVTAVIVHGDRPGRLWWTYQSPHFVTPDRPESCDLGERASEFGRRLTAAGELSEELGRRVAMRIPPGFWELLDAVAGRVAPRRPSVLFLSQEPHVPWELAVLEHSYDPALPRYLNCQTVTGRWPVGGRRPELPPPAWARADGMAVVYGESQPHPLVGEYGATQVSPALGDVLDMLADAPDVIHFTAGASAAEALGHDLKGAPFVFLEEPGDAHAFLLAGACGVVAPLWPNGGGLAQEFYRRCFAGEPPAEVLRSMRGQGHGAAEAYRFYGHPWLTLRRAVPPV